MFFVSKSENFSTYLFAAHIPYVRRVCATGYMRRMRRTCEYTRRTCGICDACLNWLLFCITDGAKMPGAGVRGVGTQRHRSWGSVPVRLRGVGMGGLVREELRGVDMEHWSPGESEA